MTALPDIPSADNVWTQTYRDMDRNEREAHLAADTARIVQLLDSLAHLLFYFACKQRGADFQEMITAGWQWSDDFSMNDIDALIEMLKNPEAFAKAAKQDRQEVP